MVVWQSFCTVNEKALENPVDVKAEAYKNTNVSHTPATVIPFILISQRYFYSPCCSIHIISLNFSFSIPLYTTEPRPATTSRTKHAKCYMNCVSLPLRISSGHRRLVLHRYPRFQGIVLNVFITIPTNHTTLSLQPSPTPL